MLRKPPTAADAELLEALGAVVEPDLRRPVGELGMLRALHVGRRSATLAVGLPVEPWPVFEPLVAALRARAAELGMADLEIEAEPMDDEERRHLRGALAGFSHDEAVLRSEPHRHPQRPGRAPGPLAYDPAKPNRYMAQGSKTRVIGISSGKGGVGKSTVTVNLAVALAARGLEVGLLDADVYGFSVPKMLGISRSPVSIDDLLVPPVHHGVRCLSMGFFVDDEQPVVWRGPMLHKALEQFLTDAYWGEPDFLLIDMPPGTGDVALSLGQYLPRTEVLVVTTPQPAAERVAQRSAHAAKALKMGVRGVIENLSWFTGDDGTRYELFGSGGGEALAGSLSVPLLGRVPLVPAVREGSDEGVPVRSADPGGEAALAFDALADEILALGPSRIYRRELTVR